VVWESLLKKPLEVVGRRPCQAPVAARGGRDAPHTRAALFLVAAVAMVGRGRGPQRAMLVPLVAAFDDLLGIVSADVRWCLHVAGRGRFLACLCGAVHDLLVAGGVLGGDTVWLLEHASEEVTLFTLPWALLAATG
jgi:hypothetical protein